MKLTPIRTSTYTDEEYRLRTYDHSIQIPEAPSDRALLTSNMGDATRTSTTEDTDLLADSILDVLSQHLTRFDARITALEEALRRLHLDLTLHRVPYARF